LESKSLSGRKLNNLQVTPQSGGSTDRRRPLFSLCFRELTVEFFATVVMFLHLGHVQAQSASVASALMTFVLRPLLAWFPSVSRLAKCFKTGQQFLLLCCCCFCCSCCCCYCGLLLLAIAGRLVRRVCNRPQCLPGQPGQPTHLYRFFTHFASFGDGSGLVGVGSGKRELLIKVLSPRCWQNEQVETRTWPH